MCAPAVASDTYPGWGKWWLPPDRSVHGSGMDSLFLWIFWITMIAFVLVEALLVYFMIKYRSRPETKKAFFSHGNTRLEMAWTIAPAIILAALALGSKKVWDEYRFAPGGSDPGRAQVLAIGQQFKWNFIYPGPDGMLGRYLLFPKPTDEKWPANADGTPHNFDNVPGPASLPYDKAIASINKYIDSENPLGKDFSDPAGKDDDWTKAPGRGLVLPAHRPIEVQLSSKDVIHSFFLPNHRVKLDAVPGMRGRIFFEATMTSAERRKAEVKNVPLADLSRVLDGPGGKDAVLVIDESAPGTAQNKNSDARGFRYVNAEGTTIMRNGGAFGDADLRNTRIEAFRAAGLTEVRISLVTDTGEWELVCAELCGAGHNTMTAPITFLSNDEYNKRNLDKPYTRPATQPAAP